MRIVRSSRHKFCADGSFMKEYILDSDIKPDFLEYLKRFGSIEMYPDLGEGFFKFEMIDCFSIKGFLHEDSFEVRYKKEVTDVCTDFLYSLLFFYKDGDPDYATITRREAVLREKVRKHLYGNN